MVQVYFGTSRAADPTAPHGFGVNLAAYDQNAITYAVADVTVNTVAGTGTVNGISNQTLGEFSAAATNAIVGCGLNLLVFIHGFNNSFEDSLTRAALNAEWYRESGLAMANTVVMAFCWPSLGQSINLGTGALDGAYRRDQQMATDSGFHLEYFLIEMSRIRQACLAQNPNRRTFLLAHSMGNWVLQAGITRWYQARQPPDDMFDEVILAAADEQADTFIQPGGGRLDHLKDVGRRITTYSNRNDAILWLSSTVNGNARLGTDGPTNKTDTALYPASLFRMADCTAVNDYPSPILSSNSHQYYRLSPTVRADIVSVMAKTTAQPGGIVVLQNGVAV
jgi:esterase/lipase superfamily enzyme